MSETGTSADCPWRAPHGSVADMRDYGAVGDGRQDCSDAFEAASAACRGGVVRVPPGVYRLGRDVTIDARVRIEGRLSQASEKTLLLRQNLDLGTYADAFGDAVEAFGRAFRALLASDEPASLDLGERHLDLRGPLDMAAIAGRSVSREKCTLRGGRISAASSPAWDDGNVTSAARYDAFCRATRLTHLDDVDGIEVGALVTGQGVGSGVFVRAIDRDARTIDLSQPLWGAQPLQSYRFRRFRYALDFSGFTRLDRMELEGVDLRLHNLASGILLAPDGDAVQIRDCVIDAPRARAIASPGRGCRDLRVERCRMIAADRDAPATRRASVALNVNGTGATIRDNRVEGFGTGLILGGTGHMVAGNEWVQNAERRAATPTPVIVLTRARSAALITGNRFANGAILLTDQHHAAGACEGRPALGSVTIRGNVFDAWAASDETAFVVLKPFGKDRTIRDLGVVGNIFRSVGGVMRRVERVDAAIAPLDVARAREVHFSNNVFQGVGQETVNPVTLDFDQPYCADAWLLDPSGWLPFGGVVRGVSAVVPSRPIVDAAGRVRHEVPRTLLPTGRNRNRVKLCWSRAVKGRVSVTMRCDKPT